MHPMLRSADARAHRRDWSRDELALFSDAASLLRETVETDSGVTDEGDPWLVFCDADSGEVLAHFARIGGQYIACVLEGALTGRVLADLVTRFLDLHPDKAACVEESVQAPSGENAGDSAQTLRAPARDVSAKVRL